MSIAAVTTPPRRKGKKSLTLWAGAILVGLHVIVGLLSLIWLPYDPNAFTGGRLEGASLLHWVGTDRLGRDLFTQLMIGSRIATKRFCGTRAEWAERKQQDRDALDAAQRSPCVRDGVTCK